MDRKEQLSGVSSKYGVGSNGFANEDQFQNACILWFWNSFPSLRRLLHCNMNNSASAIHGARAKALGVVDGVSDLEMIGANRVVFIELKMPNGVQSEAQKDFERKVVSLGHRYELVYTIEYFKSIIWEIIGK